MKLVMTEAEERALRAHLVPKTSCLEFGSGGSTLAIATSVSGRLVSVDSSAEWLDSVRDALGSMEVSANVCLHHADIGPVGDWGYPSGDARKADWAKYHSEIWLHEAPSAFDMFFVDGRFRVACFLQCMLRCRADALVLMHDYAARPQYHVVEQVAREVFREENMSGFVRRTGFDANEALNLLEAYRLEPN